MMQEWVCSLSHGRLVLQTPSQLEEIDVEDATDFLKIAMRAIPRFVVKPAEAANGDSADSTPPQSGVPPKTDFEERER
jgi:hypothetical protein